MSGFLEVFSGFIGKLDAACVDYMVVGSIGAIIYGEPRLTRGMDVVLLLRPQDLSRFLFHFDEAEYYIPPLEVLTQEVQQSGQFIFIELASGLKIDCMLRKPSPHGLTEFSRRKKQEFLPGLEVWVAAPEDIIIKNLQFFREGGSVKHLGDIRGMLVNTTIDLDYLETWVRDLGLAAEWRQASM